MMTNRTFFSPASARALRLLAVAAGCAGTALAAHADGEASASMTGARAAKTAAAAWVAAPAAKHNGSGVRVGYRVPASLQPGQAATVQLQFTGVTTDDAFAEWRAPEGGMAVTSTAGSGASMKLPRGETTLVSVTVTPSADGMAYLDVFTSQNGRTTAQSVPLKVGSGRVLLKANGSAETTPAGEKIISLPSQAKTK